jgi:hypothetical protein
MQPIYESIRKRARQIVESFPVPDFYIDHAAANALSSKLLDQNSEIQKLKSLLIVHLKDNFGHGLKHSEKVTRDAGALAIIESRNAGQSEKRVRRNVFITQAAGLLHDVKRKHRDHAVKGAEFSRQVLRDFPFSAEEVDDVSNAIRNHEAFKACIPIKKPQGLLVSNCLYDADKFRWGPDNFSDTVWDMVAVYNPNLSEFLKHYPEGMQTLANIKGTFRTATGKTYGPQFIDLGIAIGKQLYDIIITEYQTHLKTEDRDG